MKVRGKNLRQWPVSENHVARDPDKCFCLFLVISEVRVHFSRAPRTLKTLIDTDLRITFVVHGLLAVVAHAHTKRRKLSSPFALRIVAQGVEGARRLLNGPCLLRLPAAGRGQGGDKMLMKQMLLHWSRL